MIRSLFAGFAGALLVACSAPATEKTVPPRDGKLHTTETPELGGTHLQIAGTGIPLNDVKLPPWMIVPINGTVDVTVDLHIPTTEGYRGATGEATLRCLFGCTINDASPAGDSGSATPLPLFPRITIDRLEARAVFAKGKAEITTWKVESKDVRIEVVGRATLARTLPESEATGCVRFASKSSTLASNAKLALVMANAGIALDVNGLWNLKLAGRLDALALVDFGCDGATPPSRQPPDPIGGITKLSDTRYELDRTFVDTLLSNPMAAVKGARIVPWVKNGTANGFKLYSIRPESVFAQLGFTNGDTVQSINGFAMDSAAKSLEIFTELRATTTLEVKLERAGKPLTFTYAIK